MKISFWSIEPYGTFVVETENPLWVDCGLFKSSVKERNSSLAEPSELDFLVLTMPTSITPV